jgi:hypothetical protein
MPGPAARETLREHFEQVRGRLAAMAVVLEKSGIEGALSRTVLTTVVTLSRRPFTLKVFSDRRDASVWLASQGAAPSAVEAMAAMRRLEVSVEVAAPAA